MAGKGGKDKCKYSDKQLHFCFFTVKPLEDGSEAAPVDKSREFLCNFCRIPRRQNTNVGYNNTAVHAKTGHKDILESVMEPWLEAEREKERFKKIQRTTAERGLFSRKDLHWSLQRKPKILLDGLIG